MTNGTYSTTPSKPVMKRYFYRWQHWYARASGFTSDEALCRVWWEAAVRSIVLEGCPEEHPEYFVPDSMHEHTIIGSSRVSPEHKRLFLAMGFDKELVDML